jgi:SAM-dependent methyltransferase
VVGWVPLPTARVTTTTTSAHRRGKLIGVPELLKRAAAGVNRLIHIAKHRGTTVWCPVCDSSFSRFKDDWNRPDALCWRCGSHERHRAQWLLLSQRPELFDSVENLLHFAPEYCLRLRLQQAAAERDFAYVTADLDPAGVDLCLDLADLAVEDGTFDAIVCSHVLEHVDDDAQAMRELARVTKPDGWCLVMVPLDLSRETTYEDPAITRPEARLAAFWQHDHVRLYGRDVAQRLAQDGIRITVVEPAAAFTDEQMRRCRLLPSDWMLVCRRVG